MLTLSVRTDRHQAESHTLVKTPSLLGHRVITGATWITVEQVIVQIVSLIVFAVLAHYLDPHEFGLASIAFVLVLSVKIIVLDPIPLIIARKERATALEYSTAFWITLGIAAGSFAVIQLISSAVDQLFGTPGLGPALRVMSIMLLANGVGRTQEIWLQRYFQYRTLALRSGIGALAGGASGIALAMLGFGVWALVLQQVITTLVAVALLWTTCPWRPTVDFSRQTAGEILGFLSSMLGSSLASAFNQNADTVLIGLFFGPASVGVYNVAKRLRLALQLVATTPVNGIAMPALAEAQSDPARFNQALLTIVAVMFTVCGPVFLGAAAISADTISLLFGPQWAAAAPIFNWLAFAALLGMIVDNNNNVFLIRGYPSWIFGIAILNIVLTLIIFFAMQTASGAWIATPFVLPYIIAVPVSVTLVLRLSGLLASQWLRAALPPFASASAMFSVLHLIEPNLLDWPTALRIATMVVTGALIYLAALAVIARNQVTRLLSELRLNRLST